MNVPASPSPVPDPDRPARRRRRRLLGLAGFAVLAMLGVGIVLYAWRLPPFASAVQTTENATVRGQVTLISPQVSGYVVDVPVQDFQHVRRGQLLARIDDRIYAQQLAQAQAQWQTAQANLADWVQQQRSARAGVVESQASITSSSAQAQRTGSALRRADQLAREHLISEQDRDSAFAANAQAAADLTRARAALEVAQQQVRSVDVHHASLEAAVASAQAAVRLARINLDNTRIRAPRDGQLGQVSVRQGAYVTNGTQLMALVPATLWVVANFKETQMANMRIGQAASFTVDALGGQRLRGRVQEISPATGSEFSVLPPDNATGNYVKIAQRIPVKIGIEGNADATRRLRPGMSVVVSVDTASR